jgi:nucleoside-diphosphate-sugar epimerase
MTPEIPNITGMAVGSIRTLRELGQRIPIGGGILAESLHDAVKGKTIMITGASSGIGESAANQIGAAGGRLLLVARTTEKLNEVAADVEELGGSAFVHPCDLSDSADVERMAREVLAQHGHVDILVNNAGVFPFGPTRSATDEDIDTGYAVNVKAPSSGLPARRAGLCAARGPVSRLCSTSAMSNSVGSRLPLPSPSGVPLSQTAKHESTPSNLSTARSAGNHGAPIDGNRSRPLWPSAPGPVRRLAGPV